MKAKSIVNISYAKRALEKGSREHTRLKSYAGEFENYIVVVFTTRRDKLPEKVADGPLIVMGTNSRTKVGALFRSVFLVRTIMQKSDKEWIISSQDPFETSLVARIAGLGLRMKHHIQIHGDVFNPLSYRSTFLSRIRVWYGRRVIRNASALRVVSERIRHSVLSLGVADAQISVLPIQANLDSFFSLYNNRSQTPNAQLVFLYVGRFSPEKNLPLLLHAFADLKEVASNAKLRLVGAGPEESALRSLSQKLQTQDKVEFVGWTDDIAIEMRDADVFCLSSDHEGWGMVLVEAAAVGLPIITTDVGCAGEFLIHEETSLIVPVRNQEAYTKAMYRLANDNELRAKLAESAHKKAQEFALSEMEYKNKFVEAYNFD